MINSSITNGLSGSKEQDIFKGVTGPGIQLAEDTIGGF